MSFRKTRVTKPDGRFLWYYSWDAAAPAADGGAPPLSVVSEGLELRRHPLLEEWVVVAPERQERTFLPPADYCPLCPTRSADAPTEIPARDFEVAVFENRFPSFRRKAPRPTRPRGPLEATAAAGACEVVVYAPEHDATLGALGEERIARLIDVWADRYEELGARPEVDYVFVFENRGEQIGVTLTHPHGQIYAYPFVPPRPQRELAASARYRRAEGRCLQCDLVVAEARQRSRVVAATDTVLAYVPYFARYAYEVHVVPGMHRASLPELPPDERRDLARVLRTVLQKYDNLWGFPLPFVMAVHQRPTDGRRHSGCHLRIEFTPVHRSADRLKYLAGCETGAGTFINDKRAEASAEELRWAEPRT